MTQKQTLTITIHKPLKEVFAFTLDPKNTPLWIDAIVTESTNEWPPKLGTVYSNQNKSGEWRTLTLTEFEQDKMFVMSDMNGFHVGYAFTPVDTNSTELEYSLWMDKRKLSVSMTMETLEKLKQIIEEKTQKLTNTQST